MRMISRMRFVPVTEMVVVDEGERGPKASMDFL